MANLPDRKDGQRRVDHGGQSGHFYLAESGHFYLGIELRIMHIMLSMIPDSTLEANVATPSGCHPAIILEPRLALFLNSLAPAVVFAPAMLASQSQLL